MSNPHPVKAGRLSASLKESQTDAMSDRMKAKFSAYVPRQRAANEAHGQVVNLMQQPPHVPAPWPIARETSSQHFQFKSRGV